MKSLFAYIRVSTPRQGEGVSLQEQHDAIKRYAQGHDLQITDWFEERETAAKRGRPVFNRMLKLLEKGNAPGVIIHKIDRSTRNLKDWADLGELIDRGIDVHFANEGLDLKSRGGRLSADIQAVVAADFIRNLRDETRKGFYGRLKQGLFPLPAPVGYLDKGKGKPKEPDPAKAHLAVKAFELYDSGRYSLVDLVTELSQLGLRNRRGGLITKNGLSVLLNNPFYIGLIRVGPTGETFPGLHRPLIQKSLFDRVQRRLRGKAVRGGGHHVFTFSRLLTCAGCGYSLVGELQKGHAYYRCHAKTCPPTCVREEQIHQMLIAALRRLKFNRAEHQYLETELLTLRTNWASQRETELNTRRLQLGQINDRLTRLTDAFIDGSLEKQLFDDRKTCLLMNRKDVEEQLTVLSRPDHSVPDRIAKYLELASSAYRCYEIADTDERRDLVVTLTSNRRVSAKQIDLTLAQPFAAIAKRSENSKGVPHRDIPRTFGALIATITEFVEHNPAALEAA
jgi:site-specific DNA recombinase